MTSSELAAWAPTLVSVIAGLLFVGMIYGKHGSNTERIDGHDREIDKLHVRVGDTEVEIAKLTAWRDGYNAAVAIHEK